MKQLDALKKDLENQYNIPIEEFLYLYAEGMKLKALIKHFNTSPWQVKMVGSTLNLRFARKYRQGDLAMLTLRSNDKADDSLIVQLKEQAASLEQLSADYVTQAKALIKTRQQANILRSSLKKEGASDSIYEFINETVKAVEPLKSPQFVPITSPKIAGKVQFIVLSDLHCEEVVDSKQVPSGAYSWSIMESRVKKVFDTAISRNEGFSRLDVCLLGDMLNGFIHGSDVNASKHPIVALTSLAELLGSLIANVASMYPEVHIHTTTGNHDRLSDAPKVLNKSYDFSYLLYKLIEAHLANYKNVTFFISESGLSVSAVGKDRNVFVGLSHGDQVSSGNSPTGDLKTIEFFRGTLGVDVHHLVQGHFHVPMITALGARGVTITNGSLIGPGSYSHVKGFIPTPWSQYVGVWGTTGNLETIHTVCD